MRASDFIPVNAPLVDGNEKKYLNNLIIEKCSLIIIINDDNYNNVSIEMRLDNYNGKNNTLVYCQ